MLQVLLEERFKLALHRQTRSEQGYSLTVGRHGAKLPAPEEPPTTPEDRQDRTNRPISRIPASFSADTPIMSGPRRSTLSGFAEFLGRFMQCPVVDKTGISGEYAFPMELSLMDTPGMAEVAGRATGESGPSIFEAVSKLGLELKPAKVPVELLIIDHAERVPEPN